MLVATIAALFLLFGGGDSLEHYLLHIKKPVKAAVESKATVGEVLDLSKDLGKQLKAQNKKIAKLRKRPIVTVCDTGISSTKITDTLRKSGFESSYGLKGGMAAWGEAGLPVVAGKKTKSQP